MMCKVHAYLLISCSTTNSPKVAPKSQVAPKNRSQNFQKSLQTQPFIVDRSCCTSFRSGNRAESVGNYSNGVVAKGFKFLFGCYGI